MLALASVQVNIWHILRFLEILLAFLSDKKNLKNMLGDLEFLPPPPFLTKMYMYEKFSVTA